MWVIRGIRINSFNKKFKIFYSNDKNVNLSIKGLSRINIEDLFRFRGFKILEKKKFKKFN